MSENPIKPRTMRNVTIETEPEVLTDSETGVPIAVGDSRKFTGTLSHHWNEILSEAGDTDDRR